MFSSALYYVQIIHLPATNEHMQEEQDCYAATAGCIHLQTEIPSSGLDLRLDSYPSTDCQLFSPKVQGPKSMSSLCSCWWDWTPGALCSLPTQIFMLRKTRYAKATSSWKPPAKSLVRMMQVSWTDLNHIRGLYKMELPFLTKVL